MAQMPPSDRCRGCGKEVLADARFCPYCGRHAPRRAGYFTQREGFAALVVTLICTALIFISKTYEYSLILILLSLLFLLPAVVPLVLATFWSWRSRASGSLAGRRLNPAVAAVTVLACVFV